MNTIGSKENISDKADTTKGTPAGVSKSASTGSTRRKVYVGMSGGVDSSVTALLLKQAGYDVTGVFIKVWQPDATDCGWKDERRDAMRVAAMLDIPFKTFDFSLQYKKEVVDYMIAEYSKGNTPNPDIMCNRHVKFGSFLAQALRDEVDFVATGHYAQNIYDNSTKTWQLTESKDSEKDQTYFLWTLTQDDLKHVLFPIGHLEKKEVRKIAEKHKLPVFDKKDSQGVCFIGHLDMKSFLKEYIKTEKGKVLNTSGEVIGEHDGAVLYTLGERHGFTLHNQQENTKTHYVLSKDITANTITVVDSTQYQEKLEEIISKEVPLASLNIVGCSTESIIGKKVYGRIRYRQEKQAVTIIEKAEGVYMALFDNVQRGMAKGQSLVLYKTVDSGTCLGGAIIS